MFLLEHNLLFLPSMKFFSVNVVDVLVTGTLTEVKSISTVVARTGCNSHVSIYEIYPSSTCHFRGYKSFAYSPCAA